MRVTGCLCFTERPVPDTGPDLGHVRGLGAGLGRRMQIEQEDMETIQPKRRVGLSPNVSDESLLCDGCDAVDSKYCYILQVPRGVRTLYKPSRQPCFKCRINSLVCRVDLVSRCGDSQALGLCSGNNLGRIMLHSILTPCLP